jgi:hypothetical protein
MLGETNTDPNRKDIVKRSTFSPLAPFGTRAVFGFLSVAALPLFLALGCQGSLEGNFPAQSGSGSGGSGSGSGGSSGTGGGSGSGGSSGGCDAVAMVIQPSCALAGCHGGGAFDNPPNLTASNLGSALKSMSATILCNGTKYVDPTNPMGSVMYKVIAGTDCDQQMPSGNPFEGAELTTNLACMADWISHQ